MFEQDIEKLQKYYDMAIEYLVTYSFQLVGALIIFVLFLWLASKFSGLMKKFLLNKQVDITLSQFLSNLLKIAVLAIGIIIALGKIGISITPFVAAIGAISLGAGLALQGMLSNYGAGLAIILTRPFKVGNTITVQDVTGVVQEIRLANTLLINEEKQDIVIPNKYLIGDILYNSYENKLVDSSVGISYDSDPHKAIEVISNILADFKGIDNNNPAQIGIDEFGDSSINIGVRYWVPTTQFFELKYQVNGKIYEQLKANGIKIPFPQREVRILS